MLVAGIPFSEEMHGNDPVSGGATTKGLKAPGMGQARLRPPPPFETTGITAHVFC